MIYIYIVAQAQVKNLFAHVQLMNEFITPHIKNTKYGYCLSTLEIALNSINKADPQLLKGDTSKEKESRLNMAENLYKNIRVNQRRCSL